MAICQADEMRCISKGGAGLDQNIGHFKGPEGPGSGGKWGSVEDKLGALAGHGKEYRGHQTALS